MSMDAYEQLKSELRDLLKDMESSSAEEGRALLENFVKDYEASLYNEVGKLARQLHNSLTTFQAEEKILNLTKADIPDAKERLRYVVSVTEQATQNVLSIVERSIPVSMEISRQAGELHKECEGLGADSPAGKNGMSFQERVCEFLGRTKDDSRMLHGHFTEILMAQEYQDITGQIIKKVIDLVQDVEDNLVEIIKMTAPRSRSTSLSKNDEPKKADSGAYGPNVPSVDDQSESVSGQDDVDELLASLGF